MTSMIHPTAIIEPGAEIAEGVSIGPYSHISAGVVIHEDVQIQSHVVISGRVTLHAKTQVFPFVSLGSAPQFNKEVIESGGELIVGSGCILREHVTVNVGTPKWGNKTTIGNNCFLMTGAHVGHDCHVGDHVILTNHVSLGGHCILGDYVIVGGLSGVHQFVRIGDHAFVGGMSGVENDVIPYGSVYGNRASLRGLNLVGLKRRGFEREKIDELRFAYRLLFADEGSFNERVEFVAEKYNDNVLIHNMVQFIQKDSTRTVCMPAAK
ncbi:MAG: acyl-[acyl-carrier-protein]--UDP-N-acetylglucosamine O-acyltransferase [Rickettsiales bacterium]|nr:acyl-[acyl-carrier-protein]--UDP-N-acetylglucosamine O-acyltransferase [Rickettsiales bacterium]|tara:strand:- start:46966 stop:47763 length:798 start_codon:yes stop_codon:yes gene_type:complete